MDKIGAIKLILESLSEAETKHPYWPIDPVHAISVMSEEAGEAVKAANDLLWFNGDLSALKKELAQTGAMCIRALIHL